MDADRILEVVQYDVEIWDWHTGDYVADISNILTDGLDITWVLNDAEDLTFSIDLVQFEKKCEAMGSTPDEVLTPYVHDIRVRRNGEYILGCQVVETSIEIPNDEPPRINVKCTGFLNLFKDRYISEPLAGYTYAGIARKLVERGQQADPVIKNSTIDIDASYWLSTTGALAKSTVAPKVGAGCLQVTRSGTGWVVTGTQMRINASTPMHVEVWVSGQGGRPIYFRERQYINQSADQRTLYSFTPVASDTWYRVEFDFTTYWVDGYILIEQDRTNANVDLRVDDCWVTRVDDEDSLQDFNVALGEDTASAYQEPNRQMAYALQNIKDALVDLTEMEDDNFDFEFLPDRTFNCYHRKGAVKQGIEAVYPGNVDSMNINRTAANLANKIQNIGSGIGDERIEVWATDRTSREKYGTRESVITNNNVSIKGTLSALAEGRLKDSKDPTNLPKLSVHDSSINPSNVQVGDAITVKIDNGDEYLTTVNGIYRVMEISLNVSQENVESMDLTLELESRSATPYKIRYIKDFVQGSNKNNFNHWVEVKAWVMEGGTRKNIAIGRRVVGCGTGKTYNSLAKAVNNNTVSSDYAYCDNTGGAAILIDLGAEYAVDYIQVWHYYGDGRIYNSNTLSVGTVSDTTLAPLERVLWQYDGSAYQETADGKRSVWLQESD